MMLGPEEMFVPPYTGCVAQGDARVKGVCDLQMCMCVCIGPHAVPMFLPYVSMYILMSVSPGPPGIGSHIPASACWAYRHVMNAVVHVHTSSRCSS